MKVSADQLIFSAKLFVAGMIAFALAVRIGLPNPYWALVTCCVCMNPMSGAIRSKAVYRFAGTFCAGIVTLGLVAMFASTPLLLVAAAGIVATMGFGLSFLDRTPRSYGFQLFSITLMLVAVAGVDHPETSFDTVVARVSEIALGILSTTIVDAIVMPRSLGGTLRASIHRWLPDMENWARDIFDGHEADAKGEHDRLKTLADITSLSQLISTLRYDPTISRSELRHALAIQQRLLRMIPLLSAIGSRIAGLSEAEREALRPSLAAASACLATGAEPPAGLADDVRAVPLDAGPGRRWQQLVHDSLAGMLTEGLTLWSEVRRIEAVLDGKAVLTPALAGQVRETRAFPLIPDFDHASRLAGGILVSYALLCGLWYMTGWHQGANAVLLSTVALAFFGGGDEPGKAIAMFGRFAVLALTLAGLLCYGLLPLANDFAAFALVMGLFMLPLGAWAAVNPMATLVLAYGLSNINLQGHYSPFDFGAFLETGLASLLGVYVAFLGAGLFRSWGVQHQLQRFLRKEARDIARLSRSANQRIRDSYVQRALDRIAVMTARLAATGQIERSASLLSRLRVGVNVADLRMIGKALPPAARAATDSVLDQFRAEFDAPQPSSRLLTMIDDALDRLWFEHRVPGDRPDRVIHALAGLRIALFERAPAWEPSR
ncbi:MULTISPECIES: FUSC family protein [Sphingomonadales]|jgi:uncharacterized membrane protein YccC|uniref:Fusaric acid resistance protein n=4 Tax=Sphingomonadaceae TaxID=41297 RepID=A0A0S3F1C9_9SPHN|nr:MULTISPECIES: FUSC family protein [Sphingomonadaceae]ALR21504.1 hypothetical protein ATN00_15600 [Sphingobium baderi]AMG72884.1 Conserved Putative membrane protein [Sphingopyxis granuli]EQB04127.1 hypothetical protein L485_05410 [Sphingobium baderi LL03]KMS63082.1 hypothetical protein V475_04435 [Sphingobium baderi LL03]QUT06905.1 FUSC family protein [Sphingobium phenoxybenzoativorans]